MWKKWEKKARAPKINGTDFLRYSQILSFVHSNYSSKLIWIQNKAEILQKRNFKKCQKMFLQPNKLLEKHFVSTKKSWNSWHAFIIYSLKWCCNFYGLVTLKLFFMKPSNPSSFTKNQEISHSICCHCYGVKMGSPKKFSDFMVCLVSSYSLNCSDGVPTNCKMLRSDKNLLYFFCNLFQSFKVFIY